MIEEGLLSDFRNILVLFRSMPKLEVINSLSDLCGIERQVSTVVGASNIRIYTVRQEYQGKIWRKKIKPEMTRVGVAGKAEYTFDLLKVYGVLKFL